ncbi:hypothetical protein K8B29_14015 [Listeria monocytogenes]|uniref:hypothetical protein n=1 Tax=Listeria monocytogenes TaxID=1639 RepID=UPI00086D053B|nr:hypothetical protein [Listeria monocytogenes]EAC2566402.1 hypothetical protein [Listeria monocytogenes]EAC4347161.1 hypothetical protein [Listeria monocytogenes]EAC4867719.1 hypothetical protein [Listeria monocytogenes]EAC4873820.1 hypothetical protein [Listeria monocytogenes]EAC7393443.1 hypothetical protein [Listeria monocytogenes]
MPGLIAKQPNGLYCRISTVVEAQTHHDMTKEELEDLLITQRSLDINLVTLDDWLAVYEVGYQHADVFMEKIAYSWDEWEENE